MIKICHDIECPEHTHCKLFAMSQKHFDKLKVHHSATWRDQNSKGEFEECEFYLHLDLPVEIQ